MPPEPFIGPEGGARFPGLAHEEALALEVPPVRELVEDLIEAATIGTIAGLPGTYKSFAADEVTHKVAAGGRVFDRFEVKTTGPVGYWWQDDSKHNELARLQAYARRHGHTDALAIRWHLNEGLLLPDHIDELRAEVEREGQVLVVLDSFYNFVPASVKLKEENAADVFAELARRGIVPDLTTDQTSAHDPLGGYELRHLAVRDFLRTHRDEADGYAALKREICDPTGCAVCVIDHSPWPTEGNRGQRRAYGSVFKAAAVRWGIYLDREGEKLWLEARGNNIRGLKRSLAIWAEDELELRLVDAKQIEDEELFERVIAYVTDHPGETQGTVENEVHGARERVRQALEAAANENVLAVGPGRTKKGKYWYPAGHAALDSPGESQATLGESLAAPSSNGSFAGSPSPPKGEAPGESGELVEELSCH